MASQKATLTNSDWEHLAEGVIFQRRLNLGRFKLELKPGKTMDDVNKALTKAMGKPPFKTESHIRELAESLRKLCRPAQNPQPMEQK